jgi:hypothetical protein
MRRVATYENPFYLKSRQVIAAQRNDAKGHEETFHLPHIMIGKTIKLNDVVAHQIAASLTRARRRLNFTSILARGDKRAREMAAKF